MSQEAISAYEMEKHYPSVKSLLKLRDIFHVSIDYILGLSDEKCPTIQEKDLCPEEINIVQIYRDLDAPEKSRFLSYIHGYQDAAFKKEK